MTINGLWEETKRKTLGREVPVAVLAAGWFREHGRLLRIAVDTPLSLFELKTATIAADKAGGMNHITRTFMYQVLHLLSAGVQPIFVFDGSQKPTEKGTTHPAAVKLCPHVAGLAEHGLSSASRRRIDASSLRTEDDLKCERQLSHVIPLCHSLLEHLGLPYRNSPAEAEAECAALGAAEIVDAVLTRDGDAFIFGSRRVLRKLVADDKSAMVHEFWMKNLEPQGIRQVDFFGAAMLSGGDYDNGIPGCGARIALEAPACHILARS